MLPAAYTATFAARFTRHLHYRSAALAGFVAQCWWGGLKIMVFDAFYRNAAGSGAALTLDQTITYTWLSQALFWFMPRLPDPDVVASVRDGSIAHDQLRPVDTYWYWYSRAAAWLLGNAVLRSALLVPLTLLVLPAVGLGAWSLTPPANGGALGWFAVSLLLGAATSAAVVTFASASVVYTLHDRGVSATLATLSIVLTGNELPLLLFPDWAQSFLLHQPFAGVLDVPLRIWCGALQGGALASALALQLVWIGVLIVGGRALLRAALARLEVQGG